jgi:hypothetical protein
MMEWCLGCAFKRIKTYYENLGMRIIEILDKDLVHVNIYGVASNVDIVDVQQNGHYNLIGRYEKGTKVHTCNTAKTV